MPLDTSVKLQEAESGGARAIHIEGDTWFSANQAVTSAAAHATEPTVTVANDDDGRGWFPFSSLTLKGLTHAEPRVRTG